MVFGEYEFGSPKLPSFPEALVLHYLDDMDSKMGAARAALKAPGGSDEFWTAFSPALGRRLLRVDEFRKSEAATRAHVPMQGELALRPISPEPPQSNGTPQGPLSAQPASDASKQEGR